MRVNRKEVMREAASIARRSKDCGLYLAYWADDETRFRHRKIAIKRAYKSLAPDLPDPLLVFHRMLRRMLERLTRRATAASRSKAGRDSELFALFLAEARDLCRIREECTGVQWHVDHAVPLQAIEATGLHVPANLQVIPARLNLMKGNRMIYLTPMEWLKDA